MAKSKRLRDAHRAVVPRAVQKVLKDLRLKKGEGGLRKLATRQRAIREALVLAYRCESVEAFSRHLLDAADVSLLEETDKAFCIAGEAERSGGLVAEPGESIGQVVQQVLTTMDRSMNRSDKFPPPEGLPPLPPGCP